jgi:hypothetical protein
MLLLAACTVVSAPPPPQPQGPQPQHIQIIYEQSPNEGQNGVGDTAYGHNGKKEPESLIGSLSMMSQQ